MDLTKVDLEIDMIVGDDPRELFDYSRHFDGRFEPHVIPSPWTTTPWTNTTLDEKGGGLYSPPPSGNT